MNELTPVLNQLSGDSGWLAALLTWLMGAQTLAKLVQPRVTEVMTRFFLHVIRSKDTSDEARLVAVLNNPWYFAVSELLDFALRVKLPTVDDLEEVRRRLVQSVGNGGSDATMGRTP